MTDKLKTIWWHMDKLKTESPDGCLKESLFDMCVLSMTDDGRLVQFKLQIPSTGGSHVQYLIVDEQNQFKLSVRP